MADKRKLFIDLGHSPTIAGATGIKTEVNWVREIWAQLKGLIDTNYWDLIQVQDEFPGIKNGNDNLIKRIQNINAIGKPTDFLLSLHANAVDSDPTARGVETFYVAGPISTEQEAIKLSASYNRFTAVPIRGGDGAKEDTESNRPRLGILRDTKPLALLIECGFVTNKEDMAVPPLSAAQGIADFLNKLNPNYKPMPIMDEKDLALVTRAHALGIIKGLDNLEGATNKRETVLMIMRVLEKIEAKLNIKL